MSQPVLFFIMAALFLSIGFGSGIALYLSRDDDNGFYATFQVGFLTLACLATGAICIARGLGWPGFGLDN